MFVYPGFCVLQKTVEWQTLGVTKIQEALEYDAMTVLRRDSCHKCATPFGDILWHTNGNPGSQQDVPCKKIKLSVSQGSCKIIALREGSSDLRTCVPWNCRFTIAAWNASQVFMRHNDLGAIIERWFSVTVLDFAVLFVAFAMDRWHWVYRWSLWIPLDKVWKRRHSSTIQGDRDHQCLKPQPIRYRIPLIKD
jgi:hypothetical protein